MDEHRRRFGAATNPIEILDLAAYRTGRIDVNYDEQVIYSRGILNGPALRRSQPPCNSLAT